VSDWLDAIKWDAQGLVPAIAQDAVYWSRSRNKLWRKGEESGHVQNVSEIRLDCDNDVVLLKIEQIGGIACHTGRRSCFFQKLAMDNQGGGHWVATTPVLKDPAEIYSR